jgi:hypothetical protein
LLLSQYFGWREQTFGVGDAFFCPHPLVVSLPQDPGFFLQEAEKNPRPLTLVSFFGSEIPNMSASSFYLPGSSFSCIDNIHCLEVQLLRRIEKNTFTLSFLNQSLNLNASFGQFIKEVGLESKLYFFPLLHLQSTLSDLLHLSSQQTCVPSRSASCVNSPHWQKQKVNHN